jgi:LPS sulfotransferase NodH
MSQATSAVGTHTPSRSKAPVFVLGCPRSGTTLLYHMLLSAGNFVVYHTESQVFNLLEPRFGDLRAPKNRRRLLDEWERSSLFWCTGLDAQQVEEETARCSNAGDFLKTVMELMAHKQGVDRWAECTPDHLLALRRIKETIPEAMVIHIIRDGRDVALSLAKQHWIRPFPWDHDKELHTAALYWEWIVQQGRNHAHVLGSNYKEIRYEDLVEDPRSTLARVGEFIGQDLDYDEIQRVGVGSVKRPNSSFGKQGTKGTFKPVARWKSSLTAEELSVLETLIGRTLIKLGYELEAAPRPRKSAAPLKRKRNLYHAFFTGKLLLKTKTPLGRFFGRDLTMLGLQAKGPTHMPDALREPARILQIETRPAAIAGQTPSMQVAQELRRRGHFCDVVQIRPGNVGEHSKELQGVLDYVGVLFSYSLRGYSMNVHVDGASKKRCWLALAAAVTGRATSRPALVTFHGDISQDNFPRYDKGFAHKTFYSLFRAAGKLACDSETVRDAIAKYGIEAEKVRTPSDVSRIADWVTGDLAAE